MDSRLPSVWQTAAQTGLLLIKLFISGASRTGKRWRLPSGLSSACLAIKSQQPLEATKSFDELTPMEVTQKTVVCLLNLAAQSEESFAIGLIVVADDKD